MRNAVFISVDMFAFRPPPLVILDPKTRGGRKARNPDFQKKIRLRRA